MTEEQQPRSLKRTRPIEGFSHQAYKRIRTCEQWVCVGRTRCWMSSMKRELESWSFARKAHTHACSVTNHETPTLYNMTSNILKSYRQSSIKLPWNLMQLHMAKIIIYPTFSLQGGGLSAMARDALIEEYYPLRAPEGPAASQVLQPRSSWKERVYKLLGGAVCPIPLYVYLSPQIA